MIRHLIGKSLSSCTSDILKGDVNEEEVLLICTSTRHPFNNPDHFYNMKYFASIREAELLQRLWKQGRIHQPRMVSETYNHHKEDHIFPYDNYYHKHWFSIKDQSVKENVATILLVDDIEDVDPEDVEFAETVQSYGGTK